MITLKRFLKILLSKDIPTWPQVDRSKIKFGQPEYDWTFSPLNIGKESIVYSFGIGRDISFDLALIENFGVKVFAFDPTPKSIAWLRSQKLPSGFKYFPIGLSDQDRLADFYEIDGEQSVSYSEVKLDAQVKTQSPVALRVCRFSTICEMLRHDRVDILKLDIEGSEYGVIPDVLASKIEIGQILVEFHHRHNRIRVAKTREMIKLMNQQGYLIFDVSPNGYEYSFIKQ